MAMNGIEQHAVLVALLGKYARKYAGEKGREALLEGVRRVGIERGTRMAARAVEDGERLDFVTYCAYGEWTAEPGQMESVTAADGNGMAVQKVCRCAWNDAWRRHGLLEYGRDYCIPIDRALYSSFCCDLHLDVASNLSFGDEQCEFRWNVPMTERTGAAIAEKKRALNGRAVRDFDFHCAHVLYSVGGELRARLGAAGEAAVEDAKREFAARFSEACLKAMEGLYPAKL